MLSAFAVVLATLVVQGLTLGPLIRLIRLDRLEDKDQHVADARLALAKKALATLAMDDPDASSLRHRYMLEIEARGHLDDAEDWKRFCKLGRSAVAVERDQLDDQRDRKGLDVETFYELQEELDWRELSLMPGAERRIEEN